MREAIKIQEAVILIETKNLAQKILVDKKQSCVSEVWLQELLVYVSFNEPFGSVASFFLLKLELSPFYL